MKYYSDEQINYLKQIVSDEMFHMGKIEKFEQVQDNQILLKVSENKCEYVCFIEYDFEFASYTFVIKSAFGRTIFRRCLSESLFPALAADVRIMLDEKLIGRLKNNTDCKIKAACTGRTKVTVKILES